GSLGLLLAQWGVDALLLLSPTDLSGLGHVRISYPVLAFTALVSLATAVIAGVAPAFEGTRADVQESLKDGSRQDGRGRSRRLSRGFVLAEIALAVVLLVGAGLLLRSFATLQAVAPGFNTRNVLTMRVALPVRTYDNEKAMRFFADATTRVRALPGVEAAGAI